MRKLLLLSVLFSALAIQAQGLKVVITQDKKDCRYKISLYHS